MTTHEYRMHLELVAQELLTSLMFLFFIFIQKSFKKGTKTAVWFSQVFGFNKVWFRQISLYRSHSWFIEHCVFYLIYFKVLNMQHLFLWISLWQLNILFKLFNFLHVSRYGQAKGTILLRKSYSWLYWK